MAWRWVNSRIIVDIDRESVTVNHSAGRNILLDDGEERGLKEDGYSVCFIY